VRESLPLDAHRNAELALLLHAVQQRCAPSFARLYVLTSAHLFGLVLRIVRNHGDAEDILQNVYVNVWNRSDQFDPRIGSVDAWLTGIARHSAIDSLRRHHARPLGKRAPLLDDDPYAGMPSNDLQPPEVLQRSQAIQAIQSSLHKLPADQREVVLLAFLHGLSHVQIAAQLGRPLGTVKTWLRRSFAALRPTLKGHQ
jgi:RNA polymerase sigma factor (sigma-70 family)